MYNGYMNTYNEIYIVWRQSNPTNELYDSLLEPINSDSLIIKNDSIKNAFQTR